MVVSLKNKIYVALILTVLICSGVILQRSLVVHEEFFTEHSKELYTALVENLAIDLVNPLAEQSQFDATAQLLKLDQYDYVKYAAVFDESDEKFAQYLSPNYFSSSSSFINESLISGPALTADSLEGKGQFLINQIIGDEDYPIGRIIVAFDLKSPLAVSQDQILYKTFNFIVWFVAILVFILYWMNRTFFRPLSDLIKFSRSIKSTDNLTQRLEEKGDLEVKELSQSINQMLSEIQKQSNKSLNQLQVLQQQEDKLRKLVNYDALTHLPNRKYMLEAISKELARAKRHQNNCLLLFLDLDNFKDVNDSLGHESGDMFLIKIADIIKSQLREEDVLGRLGGDEFLILLPFIDREEDTLSIAVSISERILQALRTPVSIKDWQFETGVSIGIADAIHSDYNSDSMIKNADIAMYRAKNNGRNNFVIFKPNFHQDSIRKIQIANALPLALETDELTLHYQPKVDQSNIIIGLEALARWNNPILGFISPGEFIPIAENSGKISNLTRWVIGRALKDINRICDDMGDNIQLSINLSTQDVKDLTLIDFIQSQLKANDVSADKIEFEITESAYLENFKKADLFFQQLMNLGFSIALDDFGTGYSSMSYLTQLHVDTLKIDRQFIVNMNNTEKDRMIIEAMISLSHRLKIKSCAEGVETKEQKDSLFELGCDSIQGFYYAKPAAVEDLPLLKKQIKEL